MVGCLGVTRQEVTDGTVEESKHGLCEDHDIEMFEPKLSLDLSASVSALSPCMIDASLGMM